MKQRTLSEVAKQIHLPALAVSLCACPAIAQDDHGHVHVDDPDAPKITFLSPTPDLIQALTNAWGPCGRTCPWDLNRDGRVDGGDMVILLSSERTAWLDDGFDPGPDPLVPHNEGEPHLWTWTCPVEVGPDQVVTSGNPLAGGTGGGMAGDGWDGPGANPATVYWKQEAPINGDMTPEAQRDAMMDGMGRWASVVQITWYEVIVPNGTQQADAFWTSGDHSGAGLGQEPQEAGDPDCPFVGTSPLAHAGFPPGVNSQCINPMVESWAGNVHFNNAVTWEFDSEGPAGAWSTAFVYAHEVGHSIGLTHSSSPDIMRASGSNTIVAQDPSANDIANVQVGYAAGVGQIRPVETWGIWVDNGHGGVQRGIQSQPVTTVNSARVNFPPGAGFTVVHIEAGLYDEIGVQSWTGDRAMELRAENGTVTIQ